MIRKGLCQRIARGSGTKARRSSLKFPMNCPIRPSIRRCSVEGSRRRHTDRAVVRKATAQTIRKVHELNWNPLHVIGARRHRRDRSEARRSRRLKRPRHTQFLNSPATGLANDEEVRTYKEFLKKYAPSANPDDYSVLVAYMNVNGVTLVLKNAETSSPERICPPGDVPSWRTIADDASVSRLAPSRVTTPVQDAPDCDFRRN